MPTPAEIIAAAQLGTQDFRVQVTLPSGHPAIYDIPKRLVRSVRSEYELADCNRSRDDVLLYGAHLATLLRSDRGYEWFHPQSKNYAPRETYESVPDLADLCWALAGRSLR